MNSEHIASAKAGGMTRQTFIAAGAMTLLAGRRAAAEAADAASPIAVPNGSILRAYDNAWLYTAGPPGGERRAQGIWSDHMQERAVDGRHAMMRVQGMTYVNGVSSSTINVFDPQTMLPISSQTRGPAGNTIRRTFDGSAVRTVNIASPGAPEVPSEFAVEPLTYDFLGGMYGLLLVTFPLHAGARGSFRTVEEFQDASVTLNYEILGRERVAAGSRGRMQTWRVAANRPGQYNMTFWLAETPPYIVKLNLTNEGDPRISSWDMI